MPEEYSGPERRKSFTKEDQILMAVINLQKDSTACRITIEQLCKNEDNQRKDNMKIILALCGVMSTVIGQKIISTPWYVDVAVLICLFAGVFLTGCLIVWWKEYNWTQRGIRITGASLGLFSSICQMFVYHVGEEPAPTWFGLGVNLLMIALFLSMTIAGWRHKPQYEKPKSICQIQGEMKSELKSNDDMMSKDEG